MYVRTYVYTYLLKGDDGEESQEAYNKEETNHPS